LTAGVTLSSNRSRGIDAVVAQGWPMVQLQPRQFARVVSMFDGDLPNRPMLESVLADRNPGWVFADFAERATAAVVVSRYSFTYLGGRLDRVLLDFALGRSAPVGDPLVICPADKATVFRELHRGRPHDRSDRVQAARADLEGSSPAPRGNPAPAHDARLA
jgi:hypothetical protein